MPQIGESSAYGRAAVIPRKKILNTCIKKYMMIFGTESKKNETRNVAKASPKLKRGPPLLPPLRIFSGGNPVSVPMRRVVNNAAKPKLKKRVIAPSLLPPLRFFPGGNPVSVPMRRVVKK